MAWTTLADALKSAIAQGQIGETDVGASSQPKRTDRTNRPAKYTRQRQAEELPGAANNSGRDDNRVPLKTSRWEYTAPKAGAPLSEAVYCHLRVIEGGGRTEVGGGTPVRPMLKPYRGDGRANWLKLVHASTS